MPEVQLYFLGVPLVEQQTQSTSSTRPSLRPTDPVYGSPGRNVVVIVFQAQPVWPDSCNNIYITDRGLAAEQDHADPGVMDGKRSLTITNTTLISGFCSDVQEHFT